jgi:hypothetical protein
MKKFLSWLQERIKSWIKPATPVLIIDLLSDLTHSRIDLIVENALLRQQLIILKRQVKRPPLSNPNSSCSSFLLYEILETNPPYYLARYAPELASESNSQ